MLALLILLAPVVVLRSQKQFISAIQVKGDTTNVEQIKKVVNKDLEGNYLGVLPKKSIFLFPRDTIVLDILKDFPQFYSASVATAGSTGLEISVSEREPYALYCLDQKCYFLDSGGLIYSEAGSFSDGVYTVFSEDSAPINPIGERYLSESDLANLDQFFKKVGSFDLSPKLLIKSGDEYKLVLDGGAYITWKNTDDLNVVFSNLMAVFNNHLIRMSDLPNLLYIDLRFGDKVYYKFKNE